MHHHYYNTDMDKCAWNPTLRIRKVVYRKEESKLHHNSNKTKVNQNMLNLNVLNTNLRDTWHDDLQPAIHSSLRHITK